MELWIRSQEKERLIKPIDYYIEESIDYENKSSEFDIYALNLANDDIRIGTYQTKERALEVLDEIQKILIHDVNYKGSYEWLDIKFKGLMAKSMIGCVYQMPAE